MANRWKISFFALLIVFVALIVMLFALYKHYLPSAKGAQTPVHDEINPGKPIFTIKTTPKQLQALANDKLEDYRGKGNVRYHIEMGRDVTLKGTIPFLGNNIEFSIDLDPEVQKGGNLLLKEKGIRLGSFELPASRVMQYVKNSTDLPDWITILPKKEEVYVALDDIHFENQFYLRANEFNLKQHKIQFSLYGLSKHRKK